MSGAIEKTKEYFRRLFTNSLGVILIINSEGFRSQPYLDAVGIPTIGYGTTYYPTGREVSMSDAECTEDEAKVWLEEAVSETGEKINDYLEENNIILNTNQFSALVSFAYNLGTRPVVQDSTVNRGLLQKDPEMVTRGMLMYHKAKVDGVLTPLRGLMIRRKQEVALFNKAIIE